MSSDTYEILALKYAGLAARRRFESFIAADDHDSPHPIDYFIWVIRNAKHTIVVDTGFDAAEGAKRGRKVDRAPAAALEQIGISAGNVEQVVVTHLHYDHAGTLGAFPKARFHLQEAEMAYATGPCMCHNFLRYPFTVEHVCDMVKNVYSGRVAFHDGDAEVAPGVTVHKVGGQSRGLRVSRRHADLLREAQEWPLDEAPHQCRERDAHPDPGQVDADRGARAPRSRNEGLHQ